MDASEREVDLEMKASVSYGVFSGSGSYSESQKEQARSEFDEKVELGRAIHRRRRLRQQHDRMVQQPRQR